MNEDNFEIVAPSKFSLNNYLSNEDLDKYNLDLTVPSNHPTQYVSYANNYVSKNYIYYHHLESLIKILKPNISMELLYKIINIIENKNITLHEKEIQINLLIIES